MYAPCMVYLNVGNVRLPYMLGLHLGNTIHLGNTMQLTQMYASIILHYYMVIVFGSMFVILPPWSLPRTVDPKGMIGSQFRTRDWNEKGYMTLTIP